MTSQATRLPATVRVLAALACAASVAAPSGSSATDRTPATADRMDDTVHDAPDAPANPGPPAVMDRLFDDVAADSGMSRDAIVLVRAERATWPDSSRGCPQPNVGYAQVITQGFWVLLRAGLQEYDFRVGPNLDHIRCTGATKQAPIVYPDT